jgi:bloom syndrome protein
MEPFDRAEVQRLWSKDKINIICATVAFGMGNVIQTSLNALFICVHANVPICRYQ